MHSLTRGSVVGEPQRWITSTARRKTTGPRTCKVTAVPVTPRRVGCSYSVKTGPKPSCLCGECEKCRARERWRRKHHGLLPMEDRNAARIAAARVRARQAYEYYMTGVRWSDVAERFGYARASVALFAVKRILTATELASLPVRAMDRSCECMTCKTCASRERRAAYVRGDIEAYHAWARLGVHLRRVHLRERADLTPAYEATLRRNAKRCPVCRRKMIDAPYQSRSKELDHIVPVNIGGTHTVGNVRIICRGCNVARPYDGSDLVGVQTTLDSA